MPEACLSHVNFKHFTTAVLCLLPAGVLYACGETTTGPSPLDRVVVEPLLARTTAPGDSVRFEAFAVFADGTREPVEPAWSTSRPDVVRIDEDGWATGLANGAAVIEASHEGTVGNASFLVDPDTMPPELGDVFAADSRVSVSFGPVTVPITAEFRDEGSGVRSVVALFDGPLGTGITGLVTLSLASEEVTSDGVFVSVFEGSLGIPGTIGVGTWTLEALRADDRSGNTRQWGDGELEQLGLRVQIIATTGGGG